jgi:hypothetical protein
LNFGKAILTDSIKEKHIQKQKIAGKKIFYNHKINNHLKYSVISLKFVTYEYSFNISFNILVNPDDSFLT